MAFYDDGMVGSRTSFAPARVGGLRLGRVVNVYPLDLCVDIIYVDTYSAAISGTDKGGRGEYRVRVPVLTDMAGAVPEENWFSEDTGYGQHLRTPLWGYGRVVLPRVGDYVVVGFLNENYNAPVVLGCLHPRIRWLNVVGRTEDPEDEQGPTEYGVTNEPDRYITVFPSMVWTKINHYGEVEISFPLGKENNEYAGFFIKIGRDDIVGEAKNVVDQVLKAKDLVEGMQQASAILDLPEVQEIVAKLRSGAMTMAEAVDAVLGIKEVQSILSGDPHIEEDYQDGGCCCGAEERNAEDPASACTCGAGWVVCPNCGAKVSGCPYRSSWVCKNCGAVVDNPNR